VGRALRRLQRIRDVEREAFIPSPVMERLVLQVMGGWENVISEVNSAQCLDKRTARDCRDYRAGNRRAAASSMASGMPSSHLQISVTYGGG
jgi:hypothetical protein